MTGFGRKNNGEEKCQSALVASGMAACGCVGTEQKGEAACRVSLLVVFQSFFGVPNHCSLHSQLSFSLDSGVDCAAQISWGIIAVEQRKRVFRIERHCGSTTGRYRSEFQTCLKVCACVYVYRSKLIFNFELLVAFADIAKLKRNVVSHIVP